MKHRAILKNLMWRAALCLALSSPVFASQITADESLSLNDLIINSQYIVVANCAFPDRECKSPDGKILNFKVSEILRGQIPQLEDTLDVVDQNVDLLKAFQLSQKGPVKKSLRIHGYRPSVKWKDSIRRKLILFLNYDGMQFHFSAPNSFEDAIRRDEVVQLDLSSRTKPCRTDADCALVTNPECSGKYNKIAIAHSKEKSLNYRTCKSAKYTSDDYQNKKRFEVKCTAETCQLLCRDCK